MSYIMRKWEVDAIGKLVEMTAEMGKLSGENEALKRENAFLKELLLKNEAIPKTTLTRQQMQEREDQSERRDELDPSGGQ